MKGQLSCRIHTPVSLSSGGSRVWAMLCLAGWVLHAEQLLCWKMTVFFVPGPAVFSAVGHCLCLLSPSLCWPLCLLTQLSNKCLQHVILQCAGYIQVFIYMSAASLEVFKKKKSEVCISVQHNIFCTVGIGTWNKNSVIKGCTELIQQYASGDITSLHAGFYHVWSCAGFVLYSDLCAAGMAQMIFHILQQEWQLKSG